MHFGVVNDKFRSKEAGDHLLLTGEEFWVVHYPFLLSRGYRLRPRYNPLWVPSWLNSESPQEARHNAEDGAHCWPYALDAVAVGTGAKVMLKRVHLWSQELNLSLYLSTKPRTDDPRNRCVPILDVIVPPANEDFAIMVMPLLFSHSILPFRRVGELFEMSVQLAECLDFLHDHNIAHRDYCRFNIMIDSTELLFDGFHPASPMHALPGPDGKLQTYNNFRDRWSTRPNNYYVIDFGLSHMFKSNLGARAEGRFGQDPSVPEYKESKMYNPFAVDVYQLGSMMLRFCEEYESNKFLDVLKKILERMTQDDPTLRPTAHEASQELAQTYQNMSYFGKRSRIWPLDDDDNDSLLLRLAIRLGRTNPPF